MSALEIIKSRKDVLAPNHSLGSILIVAGTAIGAGMLALPITSLAFGYMNSILLLFAIWVLMFYTALVTIELNLHFKQGISVAGMSEKVLGKPGQIISLLALFLLFYALIAAYISGGSSMVHTALEHEIKLSIPMNVVAVGFTVLLASFIYSSTETTDMANRFFFTGKILFFCMMAALLSRHINIHTITTPNSNISDVWLAIPLFFTSFGFHGSIPSLYNYVGHDVKKFKTIFLIGGLIPLSVYILWQTVTLGVLPHETLASFKPTESIQVFINYLATSTGYGVSFVLLSKIFIFFSVTTSFLGVGLGLFNLVAETFGFNDTREDRLKTAFVSFIPPLFFALFYPHGFVMALGYAGIALSVLAIIMPSILALVLRSTYSDENYRAPGGNLLLWGSLLIGFLIIGIELSKKFGLGF